MPTRRVVHLHHFKDGDVFVVREAPEADVLGTVDIKPQRAVNRADRGLCTRKSSDHGVKGIRQRADTAPSVQNLHTCDARKASMLLGGKPCGLA